MIRDMYLNGVYRFLWLLNRMFVNPITFDGLNVGGSHHIAIAQ